MNWEYFTPDWFRSSSFFMFGFILARLMTILSVTPFLGSKLLPKKVKISIALTLAVFFYSTCDFENTPMKMISDPILLILNFLGEIVIGFIFAFFASQAYWLLQMAGIIVDLTRGQTLAQVFDPREGDQVSQFGILYSQLTWIVFFISGFHLIFIQAIHSVFFIVPPGAIYRVINTHNLNLLSMEAISLTTDIIAAAFLIASPFIIVTLITDFSLGLLNRIAPVMNVLQLGLPIKMWIVILMMAIMVKTLIDIVIDRISWNFDTLLNFFNQLIS